MATEFNKAFSFACKDYDGGTMGTMVCTIKLICDIVNNTTTGNIIFTFTNPTIVSTLNFKCGYELNLNGTTKALELTDDDSIGCRLNSPRKYEINLNELLEGTVTIKAIATANMGEISGSATTTLLIELPRRIINIRQDASSNWKEAEHIYIRANAQDVWHELILIDEIK